MKHFKYFKIILLLCVLKQSEVTENISGRWLELGKETFFFFPFFTFSSNEEKEATILTKTLPEPPTKEVYSTYAFFKLKCMFLKLVASLCGPSFEGTVFQHHCLVITEKHLYQQYPLEE